MKDAKQYMWLKLFFGNFMIGVIYCAPNVHCDSPPDIQRGTLSGLKTGDYYLPYDEVEIQCEQGYKYTGTSEFILCEEFGEWEADFGTCVEIFCDRPETPDNGMIPELHQSNLLLFPYKFAISYECIKGYRLYGGDSWRFCSKTGWSGKSPSCTEIRCSDPGVPEHGDREGDSFEIGSKVRFKCFTGYNLLGSFERFCMPNGQWTGELTRCDDPGNYCPNPGIPVNGFKNGGNYDIGDKVRYRCKPGYIFLGSKVRECLLNRTWSGKDGKCMAPYDFDNYAQMSEILKSKVTEKFGGEEKEQIQNPVITSSVKFDPAKLLKAKNISGDVRYDFLLFPCIQDCEDGLYITRTTYTSYRRRLILHFAFDVSGSVGPLYLKKSIEFAKAVVKKVGISRDGSRASAITFSSRATTIFLPMQLTTEEEVLMHLDDIQFTGGGTSASSAFALIKENIDFAEENYFNKNNNEHVVFIITDGKINMGGNPEMEAKALKERNIDIYCIAITGDPRIETLYRIASSSKYENMERPNVFILQNYATMSHLIQEITNGTLDFSECGLGLENIATGNQDLTDRGEKGNDPWPWIAALYFSIHKSEFQIECGATIIKENFVLTAAHCMFFKENRRMVLRLREKTDIIVKIGLYNLKDETKVQEFGVKRIIIHEKYVPGNYSVRQYDYDIALLELDGSIEYGRHVRPICLPPEELPKNTLLYSSKEFGWAGGWGYEGILNPHSPHSTSMQQLIKSPMMKELRLPIQSQERCTKSLEQKSDPKYFTDRMFCAGTGESGGDTCKGDSGGPLMQSQMNSDGSLYWTQVGIVSWGIGCGMKDTYGYYTHIQKFRSWIDAMVHAE